jgi:hypothetical protein
LKVVEAEVKQDSERKSVGKRSRRSTKLSGDLKSMVGSQKNILMGSPLKDSPLKLDQEEIEEQEDD